jgi:hypothetical protein
MQLSPAAKRVRNTRQASGERGVASKKAPSKTSADRAPAKGCQESPGEGKKGRISEFGWSAFVMRFSLRRS